MNGQTCITEIKEYLYLETDRVALYIFMQLTVRSLAYPWSHQLPASWVAASEL
jgi:hypothetical protein